MSSQPPLGQARNDSFGSKSTDWAEATRPLMSPVPPTTADSMPRNEVKRCANSGLMHRTQTRLKSDGISLNDRSGHAPDSANVRRFAYSRAENHPECWQGCCAIEEEW
jgi:hypothetical protein